MSVTTPAVAPRFDVPAYPIWKLTVDQYHAMIRTGILTELDPVELLEGWIVPTLPRGPCHDATLAMIADYLRGMVSESTRVRIRSAVTLTDSEPEPDLAIVRGSARDYFQHFPGPDDIHFLVEVAQASLDRGRIDKARIDARAGIDCYWIVNLVDMQVEVDTDPTGPDATPHYRQRQDYDRNADVPLVIGGAMVGQVRELLP